MYSFASIVKDRTEVQRREIPALVSRLGNPCNRHTWTVSSSSSESFIRHRVQLYTSSSPLQKFSSRILEFYHVKERSNEISLIYLQFIEPNQSTINLKIIPPTFKTESLFSIPSLNCRTRSADRRKRKQTFEISSCKIGQSRHGPM